MCLVLIVELEINFHSFQQFWYVPELHLLQDKHKINGTKAVHINL